MSRRQLLVVMVVGVMGLVTASAAWAATKDELKARFKERYPTLLKAKDAGTIGETHQGLVEAVKAEAADAEAKKLVSEENSDRKELYGLIAKEQNTTAEAVGKSNGERNFSRAAKGHYLKDADGKWRKKE